MVCISASQNTFMKHQLAPHNTFLLSIVTITFNNFEDLMHTIESVRDLEHCEHIIINGGNCLKTLAYLKNFSGISVSEPDQGISDAFNKGIKSLHRRCNNNVEQWRYFNRSNLSFPSMSNFRPRSSTLILFMQI